MSHAKTLAQYTSPTVVIVFKMNMSRCMQREEKRKSEKGFRGDSSYYIATWKTNKEMGG